MSLKYIKRIEQVYPDLLNENFEINENGQNNAVIIVNKSIVFRFPRYEKGINKLREETAILKAVKDRITISIPDPIYLSFEDEAFTGYELIKGTPLCRGEFAGIQDTSELRQLASQLVTFLTELHSIPVTEIKDIFQNNEDNTYKFVLNLFNRFKSKLYPFMREDARDEVSNSFETFLNSDNLLNVKEVLIHGDFGASNILWDSKCCEITGIIDFGGSVIGDPAYDLAGILSSYGEDFFNMCIDLYPNGEKIAERVRFYRSTFALQEALHGIESNDSEAFENGIKDYK